MVATRHEPEQPLVGAKVLTGTKVLFSVQQRDRCIQTVVTTTRTIVTEVTRPVHADQLPERQARGSINIVQMLTEFKGQHDERVDNSEDVVAAECARTAPAQGPVVLHLSPGESRSRQLGMLKDGEFLFDMAVLDTALAEGWEAADHPQLDLGSEDTSVLFSVDGSKVRAAVWIADDSLDGGGESVEALFTLPSSAFPQVQAVLASHADARREAEELAARARVEEAQRRKAQQQRVTAQKAADQRADFLEAAVKARDRLKGAQLARYDTAYGHFCKHWAAVNAIMKRIDECDSQGSCDTPSNVEFFRSAQAVADVEKRRGEADGNAGLRACAASEPMDCEAFQILFGHAQAVCAPNL